MSIHVLYRMFDKNGTLLYVGRTAHPAERFKAHKYTKQWWSQVARIDLQHCANHDALEQAEREAIQGEWPLYNVQEKRGDKPAAEVVVLCGECLNCDDDLGLCDDFFDDVAPAQLMEYEVTS